MFATINIPTRRSVILMIAALTSGCVELPGDSTSDSAQALTDSAAATQGGFQAQSTQPAPVNLPECDPDNPEVRFISEAADWLYVDDPVYRIFCVAPGDYSGMGGARLHASGTENRPRVLRLFRSGDPDGQIHPAVSDDTERAILVQLALIGAEHWIVHGLTLRQLPNSTGHRLNIVDGSRHNVFDRLLIEGGRGAMVRIREQGSDYNTIQNSVIREAATHAGEDNNCISINSGETGERIVGTRILSNEIYDCSDGIILQPEGRFYPETLIAGNDFYLTPARYTDCNGQFDPEGACAAAENGIDIKSAATTPDNAVQIINNRLWGFRPTDTMAGGTGSSGAALNTGFESGYILFGSNVIFNTSNGIFIHSGQHISVADNLLYNISGDAAESAAGRALVVRGSHQEVYRNIIIDAEQWGVIGATTTDYRCNTVIDGGNPHVPVITDVTADYNNYYSSTGLILDGLHDSVQNDLSQLAHTESCFWIKQWTGPEQICLPLGAATSSSPSVANCDPQLGSRSGVGIDDALY